MNLRHPNNWIRGSRLDAVLIRNPSHRAAAISICEAMVTWLKGGDSPDIRLITDALRMPSSRVHAAATAALLALAGATPDAADFLRPHTAAAPAQARMSILFAAHRLASLHPRAVQSLAFDFLFDRSWLVRLNATRAFLYTRGLFSAPLIRELMRHEKHKPLKEQLRLMLKSDDNDVALMLEFEGPFALLRH